MYYGSMQTAHKNDSKELSFSAAALRCKEKTAYATVHPSGSSDGPIV